ncbi:DUF4230 domain-containing protein [Actinomadura macrotermitis]|uniref:Uncharacterized protein n=1 Tax=Actinomadura macrotermitis TaxID=2585200 RepID=A0A7K0BSL0_9ACTN|nr:DUF4230 domain-containing protein [Actinomadura macrotermitis]MQY03664.1 hypothetical protein [Actinomadura macrotermitis]
MKRLLVATGALALVVLAVLGYRAMTRPVHEYQPPGRLVTYTVGGIDHRSIDVDRDGTVHNGAVTLRLPPPELAALRHDLDRIGTWCRPPAEPSHPDEMYYSLTYRGKLGSCRSVPGDWKPAVDRLDRLMRRSAEIKPRS